MLFAIYGIDKPDSLAIREATRADHLAYMATFDTQVGGPLLNEEGEMCGSLILLETQDLASAKAFVAGDPYGKAGLFSDVKIHQMKKVIWPGE